MMNQDQVDAVVERMETRERARCEAIRDRDNAEPSKLEEALSMSTLHRRMLHQAAMLAKGNKRDRARAASIVRQVETQREDLRNIRSLNASVAETTALAERRREVVRVEGAVEGEWARDESGVLLRGSDGMPVFRAHKVQRTRVSSRDGLLGMFESGRLDVRELEAGVRYRQSYEADARGLKSQIGGLGSCGASGDAERARVGMAHMSKMRNDVDRAVAVELARLPTALGVLRAVAGRGQTINSMVGGSASREGYAKALKRALEVAARVFKLMPLTMQEHFWRAEAEAIGVLERRPRDEVTNYVTDDGILLFVALRRATRGV